MTGLISGLMISEKCYPALALRLLIFLLLLPITTEIATAVMLMAVYHQGLHRRSKQNLHQPMIPYFPYSYSPIDLSYGTRSRAWWASHAAFSLDQYGIIRHGCLLVPPAPGFQSFVIITENIKVTLNKRLRQKLLSRIFSQHCRQKIYSWWQWYLNDLQMNQSTTPNNRAMSYYSNLTLSQAFQPISKTGPSFWRNLPCHLTPYYLFWLPVAHTMRYCDSSDPQHWESKIMCAGRRRIPENQMVLVKS